MKKFPIMSLLLICLAVTSAQAIETTIYVAEDTSATYGGLTDSVTWHGNYSAANVKAFWKFNLSELIVPPGCIIQINSANFRLHGESSYGNNLPTDTIYQVPNNNWTAGSFTIDNAPTFGPALGSYTYPGGFVSVYINCTEYLQSVLNSGGSLISFGSQAPNNYVDETNSNRFRMIGKTYTYYGIAYTPRLDIDYTIISNESAEINLSTVPIVQPTIGSVQTPIMHQLYFRGERELFGYNPRFTPSDVSFDPDNRPYIRVGKDPNGHDFFADGYATLGVIQTTDDNGNWIELDTFLPAIKVKYPSWDGTYMAGVSLDERIVFDSSGDAYMVVNTCRSNLGFNVLLYSKDKCRTWKIYPISSTYFFTKWEVPDGNNDTDKPPVLMVYSYGYTGGPIYLIVPQKTVNGLILPVVTVTTDPLAYPMPNQSGMGNSTVSKGNLIHVQYLRTGVPGSIGTPQYVVTYDRTTGTVTEPVLIAVSNNIHADIHDGAAITIDSQGYLHVVVGAHHGSFKYTKSLAPNSSTSGWTPAVDIGDPNYAGWTYVSLLCDKNDTIHVVGRNAGYCYYFGLWYLRRPASGVWEDVGPLVMPFRAYYSNWYHRLSLDRQNRLFLNYMYYGDQYDYEGGPEIAAYRAKWPWETIYLDPSPENREVHGSWIGLNGHDPCMIMSDNGGSSWRIALSTSLQLFFNNTFENGLDGWTLTKSGSTNPIKTMSSYTYNGKTILPRTGGTFAVSERSANWKKATRTLAVPQAGVFSGYMNMVENTDVGMIGISTPGHEFSVAANLAGDGKLWYRIDSTQTPTNIAVTPQTWHKVKFVANPSGIDAYWDQTLLFHSDLSTKISSMSFGSAWTTAPCGYDDFAFVPNSAVLNVTPESRNVDSKAGTTTFAISNTGDMEMPWTAEIISGGEWLSITSGSQGTNSGTVTVSYLKNNDTSNSRTATIRITAAGAIDSPKDLTVVQAKGLIPGDANNDGMVDVGDLGILAANYGRSGMTWAQGDFNGDGKVDVGDLGILAANYGTGVNGTVDFNADYAQAFGTTAVENDSEVEEVLDNTPCSDLGLPLIAGLLLAGLMLMKSEE